MGVRQAELQWTLEENGYLMNTGAQDVRPESIGYRGRF